jgi:hypothetical protein
MEQEKDPKETVVSSVTNLIDTYRNLISLKVIEHTSLGLSISVIGILLLTMVLFVLLFVGMGSAWWLGEYLSNMKAGFFIVGGFYTLLFVLLLLTSSKTAIPRIRNLIIRKIYEEN